MNVRPCWKCGAKPNEKPDIELLRLLASPEELSIEEIAQCFGQARSTVKNRTTLLYKVLGVKTRTGAVLKAQAMGLL